jgi:RHS repeat-associated protein
VDIGMNRPDWTADPVGRVTRQILPGGKQISFAYDSNGNMTKLVPPSKPEHGFGYNEVDLNDTYTPPEVGIGDTETKYGYNLAKQPTIVTRPDGKTIGFTYDTSGRLQELLIPEGEITYAYHADTGNLTNILAPDSTMSYTYDGSLLEKTAWSGLIAGNVSVTYNDDLMVTSQSVNDGDSVSYGYDDDGLLTSAGELTISRDAQNGMMTGSTIGSVSDSITYNVFGELRQYQAKYGGSTLYSVDYGTRDKLGRIVTKTETVNGEPHTYSYVYDPNTDELTDVYKDGALVSHYDYDANGNRVRHTGENGTFSGTYDDQDRMLSYGGNTYQYTANGELASKTNAEGTTVYDYDVLGNLRAVTLPDGTRIEYVIDGGNRRIGKKVNGMLVQGFLYQDVLNPVVELDGSGNVIARFVYGSRINVPDYIIKEGITYRLISDHLGSPRVIINVSTGEIVQRIDYDEYGNVTLDTNPGFQPFGFAGGLYDQHTKLVRFGNRDYDAESGRWTSKDFIRFIGGDTNLYSYCSNDPVNYFDPYGLSNIEVHWDWNFNTGGVTIDIDDNPGYTDYTVGLIIGELTISVPNRTSDVINIPVGGGIVGDPFGLENQDQNSNVIPIGGGIVGDPFGLENQDQKAKGEQKRQECK